MFPTTEMTELSDKSWSKLRERQNDYEVYIFDFSADLERLDDVKWQALDSAVSYKRKATETGMIAYETISNEFDRLNQCMGVFLKRAWTRMEMAEKMSEQLEEYFKDLLLHDDLLDQEVNEGRGDRADFLHETRLRILYKVTHTLEYLDGYLKDFPATSKNLLRTHQRMSQTPPAKVDRWVFVRSLPRADGLCSICLDDSDVEGLVQLPCHVDHIFHLECLERWLEKSKTCPLDRKVLFGPPAKNASHAGTVPYSALHDRPHAGEQRRSSR